MGKIAAVLLLFFTTSLSAQKTAVLTQHNNNMRTGWNDKETVLNHNNVSAGSFGLIATLSVDDQVYAQPLVVANVTIGSYTGSVLFVVTVNNTVYAFNADDPSQSAALWQTSLIQEGQRSPAVPDLRDINFGAPCGGDYRDISGKFGTISTPVIDTITQTIYVVTKTIDGAGNFYAWINALDITTGHHKNGSPKLIDAVVPGTGDGSANGQLRYNAKLQNQRAALLLYNNIVYVGSASYCDWGPYHGWLLGIDASTLELKYTYNATPNGWAGGIWMAGQGPSVGEDGNIYLVTGNGTTSPDNNDMNGGRSESLIKLTPDLKILDWFTPANYELLDELDLDYGCDGVLMIPNSSLTVSGSKEGISYVVDYNNMGRFSAANAQVKDTLEFNPGREGNVHVHGSPVYVKLSTGEFVIAWAESFKIRQFELDRSTGTFKNDFKQGLRNLDYGMPGAMLSVSSNGDDTSTAIVWGCFPTSGNANFQTRPGSVAAYRANDVSAGELWSSDINSADDVGNFAKFNSPTVANGKLYVPTFSNSIKVYGTGCSNNTFIYGNGTGLKAEYFTNSEGADFPSTASVIQTDNTINFNWGSAAPANGVSNDNFKVRWTGKLKPLTDDTYTLYVTANDGVRLWINNALLIDNWKENALQTHSATILLQKNNEYDIKLEHFSHTAAAYCILQWSANDICKQVIPATQLITVRANCMSSGTGLTAAYFNNANITGNYVFPAEAEIKQTVPDINFNWAGGSPAGVSADNFTANFSGFIETNNAGTYTFYVTADDGVRLWVNNQLLIDRWVDQAATEYSATINLEECTKYPIRIEYYERGGDAVCKLEWSGPADTRQVVPAAHLYVNSDLKIDGLFTLFPNPAKDEITIAIKKNFRKNDLVLIYDVVGRKISEKIVTSAEEGINKLTIPVAKLMRGIYVLHLKSAYGKGAALFIKQ